MENYTERLEYLVNLKKKEPNKLERDEFENAWTKYVKQEGFTSNAERYLYTGLRFCSAKPFKEYMKTQDMMECLNSLYSGKLFGDNCASTIQILFHLLAFSINEFSDRLDVIISLIKHIPSALMNKEGKVYGQADRVIKKYFLDELKTNVELPAFTLLIDNGLNAKTALNFAKKLETIINGMDSENFSRRCKENIAKTALWVNPPKVEESDETAVDTVEDTVIISADTEEVAIEGENVTEESVSESDSSQESVEKTDTATEENIDVQTYIAEIAKLKKEITELTASFNTVSSELSNYKAENDYLKRKVATLEKELECAKKEDAENHKVISELRTNETTLRTTLSTLEQDLSAKDQEISQRIELIEMLRRDRSKQSDESQKRIASKLRSYYADYVDAQGLEMSVDLGENMRDQLGEVFKILMSAGISVK